MTRQKSLIGTAMLACIMLLAPLSSKAAKNASSLFAHAKAQAHSEHKPILLVFSASWCGPCKLYERFLEDPAMKAILEKAFVVQRIAVGEHADDKKHADTPGGTELRSDFGAVGEPGYPFIAITDESGTVLANSYRNGDTSANIGYPASPAEIAWYLEMLKRGAPSLSQADLTTTRAWLQEHAPH